MSMSGKSSMRRKSNSLLQAFGKPSSARQSAIPLSNHSNAAPSSYPNSSTTNNAPSQSTSAPPSANSTPLTATTATFNADELGFGMYSPSPEYDTMSLSSRTASVSTHQTHSHSLAHTQGHYGIGIGLGSSSAHGHGGGHGGRSISANYSIKEKGKDTGGNAGLRRPEDVFRLVRERMLSWSYMIEWYQGDTHWLNTVRISRSTFESAIGSKNLESRARNFYVLGISMSALFDIPSSGEFLKALIKLLDDWEAWSEGSGGKGVKNLFRGQRSARKVTAGGSMMSDFAAGMEGSESYLLNVNLPFVPDFFQVHSSFCSIIRDVYKKLLGMFLLPPPSSSSLGLASSSQNQSHIQSLLHPLTIIQSAPLETPFGGGGHGPGGSMSPTASTIISTFTGHQVTSPTSEPGHERAGYASFGGTANPSSSAYNSSHQGGGDALQAFIAGELPGDRTLVGDGQKLTPQVVELFMKVDTKLKKHFSTLLREGDLLARRVLDEELQALLSSLTPGARAMTFDVGAATIGSGAGWSSSGAGAGAGTNTNTSANINVNPNYGGYAGREGGGTVSGVPVGFSGMAGGGYGLGGVMDNERRERDFGTI